MAITVRELIIKTLINFKVEYDPKIVNELENQVRIKAPQKPLHYADVITRHKAIDLLRRKNAQQKRQWWTALREEKLRQTLLSIAAVKEEFEIAAAKALGEVTPRAYLTAKRNIEFLRQRIFGQKKFAALRQKYPQYSYFLLRKGVKRARKLLQPFTSPELQKVISWGCWRKRRRRKKG